MDQRHVSISLHEREHEGEGETMHCNRMNKKVDAMLQHIISCASLEVEQLSKRPSESWERGRKKGAMCF
jgi:hypothetical protein